METSTRIIDYDLKCSMVRQKYKNNIRKKSSEKGTESGPIIGHSDAAGGNEDHSLQNT